MPGNEVGDRVHNFFAQDNLSHGQHHSQALDGNWSVLSNNLWSSQRQVGLTSSSTKNCNRQQSDTDRGQIGNPLHGSHDLNFTRSFPRPEYAKSQTQSHQPNFNGFMHGNKFYQTRQDETNFVAVDTNSDQHNLISRSIPAHGSQQVSSLDNQRKSSVRSETSGSPVSFDFLGDQRQMSQPLSMLQSLQHQPSGLNDMQQLQQQVMLMKVQELQRQQQQQQQQLQQMDARQQFVINQMSPFAKQASASQTPSLINGSLNSESLNSDALNYNSAELGNPNWLQRNGPAMQGSSNGLVFSPNQGKAQCMVDLVPQQVEQSLYGFPISCSRGSLSQNPQMGTEKPTAQLLATFGNSLPGNQQTVFPAQGNTQERNLVARPRVQAENSFAHASDHPLSTATDMENIHQLNMQRNARMLEFHGRQEQLVPPETLPGKTETQDISSRDDVALDPTEQRILFGSDDNIWAAFGKSPNGGEGSNLFGGGGFNGVFSFQSGTWSALMQSAVAETSSNDIAMQEEWSGLNYQNIDIPSGNQHALSCNDDKKQQTPLVDDNLLMASSFGSGTVPSSGDANIKKNYQNVLGFQQFGHKLSHETDQKLEANPSQGLDQLSKEGGLWSNGIRVQKSVAEGSQMHGNAYSLDDEGSASRQICNKPNVCKVFGSVAPHGDAGLWVQGSANSMHHYRNNEQKQIIHGEVVDGGSLWKSNSHDSRIEESPLGSAQVNKECNTLSLDSTTLTTGAGSSPFLPNSYQLNYLKNVDPFVKSNVDDAVEGPQNDNNIFSCEEGKGHEMENNDKQENSNDSYRSILSHHTLAGGRKENGVADAIGSRTLSADKQKSSNQTDRRNATLCKFQYHPMGNMDDDVEPPYGMKQPMYSQAMSHFGQLNFLGQVPKNSIEMGKGQPSNAQRSTKYSDEVHSPGNVPVPIPNISAPFDGFMNMDTPDKASQLSQNMLELLNKVDQSRGRAAMMHVNAASETPLAENSDGSVGRLQRSQSSNSQGFGLQLGPPMQRLPISNQSSSSQSSLQMVSSLHSNHAAPEIRQKGQVQVVTTTFVQSMPPSSVRSQGEINRSGIPGQTDNEISGSKMPGKFSSAFNSGFPQLRGNFFSQEVAWAGGQLSRPFEKCGPHSTQKDDPHYRPPASQSAETTSPEAGSIPQGGNSTSSTAQKTGINTGQVLAPQILAGMAVPVSRPSSTTGNSLQRTPSKALQSNVAAQHLLGAQFHEVSSHFSQSNETNVANSTSASLSEFDQDGKQGKFQSEFGARSANSQGFRSKEEQLTKESTGEQVSPENINLIQKINSSHGKELSVSDGSPVISVSTLRDIEAFGRSLKSNNCLQQNYSLSNQVQVMKNTDDEPSNRVFKRMKGLDSVGSQTVSPVVRQSNDLTAIVGDALVPCKTNSSLDPTMLSFSATDNNVASSASSQHGNIASQGVLAFSRDGSQSSSNAAPSKVEHSEISPQIASSWFNHYGTLNNGQILQLNDALKAAIVKTGAQPFTLGMSSSTLPTLNSMEPLNAAAVDANGSIWQSATPSLAVKYLSSQILRSNANVQHPVLSRTKKRKTATSELDPWHKEVSQGSRNLQTISMAEVEWAKSANRRIDKVETEVELLEDGPLTLQQKRRLILTTQLIQQLLRPAPAAILSMDANMDYESVAYYVSRLALGDACSVVSLRSKKSNMVDDSMNGCSDDFKTSERVHDELLLKVIEDFMARARKLENEFLRLDKNASVLDLIVECQDLEKFSVINRFAKFHGRGQADSTGAASSADAAAHTQKPHPQRYVTALPLPRNFPTSVQCCSL